MAKDKRNFSKGGSNRRGSSHVDSKDIRDDKKVYCKGSKEYDDNHTNDISWYNKNGFMFENATQIPFNRLAGIPYKETSPVVTRSAPTQVTIRKEGINRAFPSIMSIDYTPGIGVSTEYSSAPNRAFQSMYSAIYSKTTGAMQFPQYALALTVVAIQSIAQNIGLAKRALETSRLYSAMNMAYPRMLLTAQGFNPDTIIGNQANLRLDLNDVIMDFNALKVPAYIDVFQRHYTLAHSLYADADSVLAQIYLFKPTCYYMFSDLGRYDSTSEEYDGKACCIAYPIFPSDGSVIELRSFIGKIREQIRAIRNSADFGLILGSIIRAFPDASLLSLNTVNEDEQLIPTVDTTMSYQIHNLTFGPKPVAVDASQPNLGNNYIDKQALQGLDITGDPVSNDLLYQPVIPFLGNTTSNGKVVSTWLTQPRMLNTYEDSADKDFIMESTRLMSNWEETYVGPNLMFKAVDLGTEWVSGLTMYYFQGTGAGTSAIQSVKVGSVINTFDMNAEAIQAMLSKFHKAPRVALAYVSPADAGHATEQVDNWGYTGDVNLWTTVDPVALKGLHRTALLSIFNTDNPVAIR